MGEICRKCGHDLDIHKIVVIGNFQFQEIQCQSQDIDTESYDSICGCDAGFRKLAVTTTFKEILNS